MKRQFPWISEMLLDACEDVSAFHHFPTNHGQKILSTNSLEHLNVEIRRITTVVGTIPNADVPRLIAAVCVETHDEWSVSERRYIFRESKDQPKSGALLLAQVALAKVK